MTTFKISESGLVCSICLEDFEVGVEAREMPCLRKYHILSWLKLHSTCPVCMYQMPIEEEREKGSGGVEGEGGGEGDSRERRGAYGEAEREGDGGNFRERRVWINFPWLVSISENMASENRDSGERVVERRR
ncbi:hypothetical protein AMTRI_Chr02g211810 [Amborella trichopoda]